jgi:Ala-tRNA(Pro) deacylase
MKNEVYELLDKLQIKYTKIEHPPLFTSEDNKKYDIKIEAVACKNLFLRNNSKSQYYVVVLPLEKRINLKSLQIILEETRLSFGDEHTLEEKLGTKAGSVSIFNIMNQKDKDIIFVLDENLLEYEKVGFHPNINTETIIFHPKELHKIFECYQVAYKFVNIPTNKNANQEQL